MRNYRLRIMSAAVASITIVSVAMAGAGAAVGPVVRARPGSQGPAGLSAVSCPRSSWCMAVGSHVDRSHVRHALALVWNGQTWRALRNPPGGVLRSVSCSSASFCMARSGLAGRTEVWNGRAWRAVAKPEHAVTAPSCGSRSLCMLINGLGVRGSGSVVESWNGRTWRTWWRKTSVCIVGVCGVAGVSCGSPADCLAVGTQEINGAGDQFATSQRWHRGKWLRGMPQPPFNWADPTALNAVSCAGRFCMAVGFGFSECCGGWEAAAATWNGSTGSWTDVSQKFGIACSLQACAWTAVISCGSPANCMTLTFKHGNLAWNGTSWNAAPFAPAGRGAALVALSCHKAFCVAVGHRIVRGRRSTLAEFWNGTTWTILTTPR